MARIRNKVNLQVQLKALDVEMVDIQAIVPNEYNPNRQSEDEFELLKQSIRSDGFTFPILVGEDNVIIDGEHRWRAALELGYTQVPVVRLDLDRAKRMIATIRHNRARGEHDQYLEATLLEDLEKLEGLRFIEQELLISADEAREIIGTMTAPDMFAGYEFSQSWVPASSKEMGINLSDDGKPVPLPSFGEVVTVDGSVEIKSLSSRANEEAYRLLNRKARGEEGLSSKNLFKLGAVLSRQEGEYVREVLECEKIPGDTPAERFMNLCLEKFGAGE